MPNGHGIEKSTYVNSNEETHRALTFDLLNTLHKDINDLKDCQKKQVEACTGRFERIESSEKRRTVKASASGGIGGFIFMVLFWIKNQFSGN